MAAQFAEIQLRRELDETRDDAVRYAGSRRDGDLDDGATFEVARTRRTTCG